MSELNVLEEIKLEHNNCRKVEKRIRHVLYGIIISFGALAIASFGNNLLTQQTVRNQGDLINVIRMDYVSYDNFFLFNRTYEMQLAHMQAYLAGDADEIKRIHGQYNELRSLIVRQRLEIRGENRN